MLPAYVGSTPCLSAFYIQHILDLNMSAEFRPNANFEPTGPFVGKNFVNQEITYTDVIISAVIWVFTLGFMGLAIWTILKQMKSARSPLRSLYIWLAWIEIAASLVMGIVSFLHLLKVLRPCMLEKPGSVYRYANYRTAFAVFLAIGQSNLINLERGKKCERLTQYSLILVPPSTAIATNHNQPHSRYHARPPTLQTNHDSDCSHHNRHQH